MVERHCLCPHFATHSLSMPMELDVTKESKFVVG